MKPILRLKTGSRRLRIAVAVSWLILICILSVIPVEKTPEAEAILDAGHILVYTVQTILFAWAFTGRFTFIQASLAASPVSEVVQLLAPWRTPSLLDVGNNIAGVALGILVSLLAGRILRSS